MFSFYEFEAEERHNERMRFAENSRLIKLATAGNGRGRNTRGRAMVWLGNRLVASGRKLQASYR